MKLFVWRWLINCISILVVANLVKGVVVESFLSLLMAAVFLGVLNAVIRPVLLIFTLPINILTLGLFTLIINALILFMVAFFVPGFAVGSFFSTVFAALLISVISMILSAVFRQ